MSLVADRRPPTITGRPEDGTRLTFLLAALIGAYAIVNSLSIKLSAATRIGYFLLAVAVLATFLHALHLQQVRPLRIPFALLAWSGLMVVELGQLPFILPEYRSKAISDFVVMMLPLLLYGIFTLFGSSRQILFNAGSVIVFSSFLASLVGWSLSAGQRFDAPQILAITGAWVLAASPREAFPYGHRTQVRAVAWVMVVVLLPAILAARSRTSLAAWVLAGAFVLIGPRTRRIGQLLPSILAVALLALVLLGVSSQLGLSQHLNSLLGQARLTALVTGRDDVSGEIRVLEVLDVRSTMAREGNFLNQLLGFSHGASYVPQRSDVEANMDPVLHRVHNIHVAPVMIWFRYGVVGEICFLALLAQAFVVAVRSVRLHRDALARFQLLSLFIYCISLLFFNSTADPSFSWIVAAVLASGAAGTDPARQAWSGARC